jgi:aspartyl-tRNA(Asn)/glutamyl-tRNA(Gln) amidotransferase subunit A
VHGIPIALKDLFDTAGVRTTAGSAVFCRSGSLTGRGSCPAPQTGRRRAAREAEHARVRLRRNLGAGVTFGPGSQPVGPPAHIGWIVGRFGGGPSRARLCYARLGPILAGSIRQPSAYCGIVGFKPTYGRGQHHRRGTAVLVTGSCRSDVPNGRRCRRRPSNDRGLRSD